jgi:hypothetical protein
MNNFEQTNRFHAGLFNATPRQSLAADELEELVKKRQHKMLYHNDDRLKLVKNKPTDSERECAIHRITIRRAYNTSKAQLRAHTDKISILISKALSGCHNNAERALWIKYELPRVAGIEVDTDSAFHVTLAKLRCRHWLMRKYKRIAREDSLYSDQLRRLIGPGKSYATSKQAVQQRQQQLEDNQKYLSKIVISRKGQTTTLDQICNTTHKRVSELYVFSKGIDQLAQNNGMRYMLITLTCPPHMHANPTTNCSWDGTQVKQAYQFLNNANQAVKRRLANKGISFSNGASFGIIVSEPHRDGCPHLHILMYYQPQHEELIVDEYRKEFNWHERAIDFSIEDPNREDAARGSSYLFKYLSESFYEGEDASNDASNKRHKAKNIATWRSQVGIRAFRTFGLQRCATLWRNCRKLKEVKEDCGPILQNAIEAACSNDFHRFYHLAADLAMIRETRDTQYGDTYEYVRGIVDHEVQATWLTSGTCEIFDISNPARPRRLGVKHSGPRGRATSHSDSGGGGPTRLTEEELLDLISPIQAA